MDESAQLVKMKRRKLRKKASGAGNTVFLFGKARDQSFDSIEISSGSAGAVLSSGSWLTTSICGVIW